MTALGIPYCIGASAVLCLAVQCVVVTLAIGLSDRMDGGEVKYIKAHFLNPRELRNDVAKLAVRASRSRRSGKQFIPTGKAGAQAFDVNNLIVAGGQEGLCIARPH